MSSTTKIEPLGAVRERVLAGLRQEIIAGRLRPGDRLVERELAERFRVSRVPVREAIRALVAEGFVHFETPRRTVVRRLTPTDVKELFELREALEVYAAGLAASRATPEDLAEVEQLLDQAATATEAGDAEAITDVNSRLHDRILAMAGNTLLIEVLEPVAGRLRWMTRRNEEWPRLPGDAWHARSLRCRTAHVAPPPRSNRASLGSRGGTPIEGAPPPCDRTHQTPPGPPFGRKTGI
ncbi:GntR family transcriptional regulator [Streptomyces bicolor]|uniref:GntR family transcriptional regulator n=1 Tax=Streptomyces bicolor TaxID=66874 RepID=UPI000A514FA5|nr:GntR family transcriptional regulator [Streptomyces bicolor]